MEHGHSHTQTGPADHRARLGVVLGITVVGEALTTTAAAMQRTGADLIASAALWRAGELD